MTEKGQLWTALNAWPGGQGDQKWPMLKGAVSLKGCLGKKYIIPVFRINKKEEEIRLEDLSGIKRHYNLKTALDLQSETD